MRIATLMICLACLLVVPLSRAADGLKMDMEVPENTLMVQGAPGMIHFHSSSEHVRYSWLVGAEWMHRSRWLGGYSYFNNSFGQKSHYLYGGYWWPIELISPNVYFKFTAGVLHGYKGKYEDKVPFNHNGTSPGVVMGVGYKTGRFNAQANLLGGAGVMVTLGYDLVRW